MLAENDNGAWIDYIWLNGRLIGRIRGGNVYAIHDDQVGRPQVATDATGIVVWKASNMPFARSVVTDNMGGLNLGFPGQYYDADRGVWNNGMRDYNASLGRYLESDSVGLGGGINTYAYVGGNPLTYVDPSGLRADTDLCAGLTAQGCMQMGQLGPDYVTLNITVPSVFEFGGTITRSGAVFRHGGFTLGSPQSIGSGTNWGFNLSLGFLANPCHTSADVNNLVDGSSTSGSFYDGAGGGIVHNGSGTAIEMGVGFGGGSGGASYAGQAGQIGPGLYYVPTPSQ